MLLQSVPGCELCPTLVANVTLFGAMIVLEMLLQLTLEGEGFWAILALEGLFLVFLGNVTLYILPGLGHVVTFFTVIFAFLILRDRLEFGRLFVRSTEIVG